MKAKMTLVVWCAVLAVIAILTQSGQSVASASHCKELNQVNCYAGQNEGYFCSSKDQTKSVTRWFYDKNECRKFIYKGCYGNRNRFCSREACERRCGV